MESGGEDVGVERAGEEDSEEVWRRAAVKSLAAVKSWALM